MAILDSILSALKLPVRIIVGIALFAGLLLILPQQLVVIFRLRPFIDQFGTYIGIAFLAAASLLVTNILYLVGKWIKGKLQKRNTEEKLTARKSQVQKKILFQLDSHEKAILREFIIQGKNTIKLPMDNSVVAGLIQSGVIRMVGQFAQPTIYGLMASFSLSEYAIGVLQPECLDLPNREPTPQEIQRITSERPAFVLRMQRFEGLF